MSVYVLNEWLWADLAGENGAVARRQAFTTMERFAESTYQLIVVYQSRFDKKAWALCRSHDVVSQRLGRAFVLLIRSNLDRCRILYPQDLVPLPEELVAAVKPDDHYLVQACLTVPGSILVTVDNPLGEVLAARGLSWIHRDALVAQFSI